MAEPLRIVFDTNVYISAALHGRLAEKVLELASAGQVTLITSEPILTE
ncbi:MAG: PIN domain-containing protein [Candidatus Promineifilaceae bacterium]